MTNKKICSTHESCVSFEAAELLQNLKFNWGTRFAYYVGDDPTLYGKLLDITVARINDPLLPAPTLEIAQKFLREEYKLHITIYSMSQESWMYRVTKPHQKLEDGLFGEDFYTYEQAQSDAIDKITKQLDTQNAKTR